MKLTETGQTLESNLKGKITDSDMENSGSNLKEKKIITRIIVSEPCGERATGPGKEYESNFGLFFGNSSEKSSGMLLVPSSFL